MTTQFIDAMTNSAPTTIRQSDIEKIRKAVELHTKYSKSYFWSPACTASGRRYNEWDYECKVRIGAHLYRYDGSYQESCRNCYYAGGFYMDGVKHDVRLFKRLLKQYS